MYVYDFQNFNLNFFLILLHFLSDHQYSRKINRIKTHTNTHTILIAKTIILLKKESPMAVHKLHSHFPHITVKVIPAKSSTI